MKQWLKTCCGLAGTAALAVTSVTSARADDTVVVTTPHPVAETSSSGPNAYLFRSGLVTFGVAYIPALVVAIESDRSADNHLYAPIVGPWFDLANRDDECGGGECGNETVNKVLLVTDGVFQAVGGLLVVGAFLNPEERTVTKTSQSHLLVAPTVGQNSFGLTAVGVF